MNLIDSTSIQPSAVNDDSERFPAAGMTTFQTLPSEILCMVAERVQRLRDLLSLTKVCQRTYIAGNPILYRHCREKDGGLAAMHHGLCSNLLRVVMLCLEAGVDPNISFTSRGPLLRDSHTINRASWEVPGHLRAGMHRFPALGQGIDEDRTPPRVRLGSSQQLCYTSAYESFHPHGTSPRPAERHEQCHHWRPLHSAAALCDVKMIDVLLDHGADPSLPGTGVCACDRLCSWGVGDYALIRQDGLYNKLSDFFDDAREAPKTKWSPFHVAVCKGRWECAEKLMDRGGAAHLRDNLFPAGQENPIPAARSRLDPYTPLHVIARYSTKVSDLERVYQLLKRGGFLDEGPGVVDVPNAFADTPLAVAALSGHFQETGQWFFDHGASIDIMVQAHSIDANSSLFLFLCYAGCFATATLLMNMGAIVSGTTNIRGVWYLENALHLCCHPDHPFEVTGSGWSFWKTRTDAKALLQALIAQGLLDMEAQSSRGMTPFLCAAMSHSIEALQALLEAGAAINVVDKSGSTALHLVFSGVRSPSPAALQTVQFLLDHDADVEHRNNDGVTPLMAAMTYNYYLGGEPSPFLMAAIALLLRAGANPNARGKFEQRVLSPIRLEQRELSPIGLAVTKHQYNLAEMLLCHGARVSLADYRTSMHVLSESHFSVLEPGEDMSTAHFLLSFLDRNAKSIDADSDTVRGK